MTQPIEWVKSILHRRLRTRARLVLLEKSVLDHELKLGLLTQETKCLTNTCDVFKKGIENLSQEILSLATKTEQRYRDMEARKIRDEEMNKPTKYDEIY